MRPNHLDKTYRQLGEQLNQSAATSEPTSWAVSSRLAALGGRAVGAWLAPRTGPVGRLR
jgi:hypothetical protein